MDKESTKDVEATKTMIPHEIVVEILSRLPIISVDRFSCVSKQWRRIIIQSYFRDLHCDAASLPIPFAVLKDNRRRFVLVAVSDLLQNQVSGVLQLDSATFRRCDLYSNTCNGLICTSNKYMDQQPVSVWNPLTGAYITLPLCTDNAGFWFDSLGIGFSPSTKEYKVVRIYKEPDLEKNGIWYKICSIGVDKSWRTIHCAHICDIWNIRDSLYMNGKLYWFVSGRVHKGLMSLDLETEEMSLTPTAELQHLPRSVWYSSYKLVELGGRVTRVAMVNVQKYYDGKGSVTVWMLHADGDKKQSSTCWIKRCTISISFRSLQRDGLNHVWECDRLLVFWFTYFVLLYDEQRRYHWSEKVPDAYYTLQGPGMGYRPSLTSLDRYGGCKTAQGFAVKREKTAT